MTAPRNPADFFALEAGECLNRLERELGHPDAVRPDQFVQHARELRGSALLANQRAIARAASALERLARAVRDGRQPWDHGTREVSLQAVDEFRALIRHSSAWSDAAEAQAVKLGATLEALGGASPAAPRAAAAAPDAGMRAFIAREGALVASALDRAARALRTSGEWREALQAVLRRMQPLRGLAGISELAPLPDILEGTELAVGEISRPGAAAEGGAGDVVESAAHALTRVCRDVAEGGLPVADSPEAQRFTELLLRTFAAADQTQATAVSAPRPAVQLSPLEMVSHGEHLGQAANDLDAARSQTERDLRLVALVGSLRMLARAQETAGGGLAAFAETARDAIESGHARQAPAAFAAALRQAGALLRGAADARDSGAVVTAWKQCAQMLAPAGLLPEPTPAPAAAAPAAAVVDEEVSDSDLVASLSSYHQLFITRWSEQPSLEGLLGELRHEPVSVQEGERGESGERGERGDGVESDIVSIDALAPDAPLAPLATVAPQVVVPEAPVVSAGERGDASEADIVAIEALAPDAPVVSGGEWDDASEASIVSIEAVAPDTPNAPIAPAADIVPVATLLYRGRSALERAATIRHDLTTHLDARADWSTVQPLIEELLDLVPLALDDA